MTYVFFKQEGVLGFGVGDHGVQEPQLLSGANTSPKTSSGSSDSCGPGARTKVRPSRLGTSCAPAELHFKKAGVARAELDWGVGRPGQQ